MKKLVYYSNNIMTINEPTDYIILEKDNQDIDDKYVDYRGKKFNEYNDLEKGDLIIRGFYHICFFNFHHNNYNIIFKNFKYYVKHRHDLDYTDKVKSGLRTKNSVIDFDNTFEKNFFENIVNIFSEEATIYIE